MTLRMSQGTVQWLYSLLVRWTSLYPCPIPVVSYLSRDKK